MTHFSLFSGIGGLDLAAEWAGFETVGQCEFADYPTKILEKHWPDVPRWGDIRSVTAESFRERTGLSTVTIISGGFPCQPFSVAGKQKGKEDDRYLWPEMLRVIRELKPRWVLGENVPGILRIAGDTVCQDLEREGYDVGIFNFEAAAVGAKHRRSRVFFVGNAKHNGQFAKQKLRSNETASDKWWEEEQKKTREFKGTNRPANVSGIRGSEGRSEWDDVADTNNQGLQISGYEPGVKTVSAEYGVKYDGCNVSNTDIALRLQPSNQVRTRWYAVNNVSWWAVEPNVGRVAHGIPNRVDRLKCLGNAVVPQQVYPILRAIYQIETGWLQSSQQTGSRS